MSVLAAVFGMMVGDDDDNDDDTMTRRHIEFVGLD